jgi:hypothetical protein
VPSRWEKLGRSLWILIKDTRSSLAPSPFFSPVSGEPMDAQKITCPVPKGNRACGREEILEKKKPLGKKPGSRFRVVHHECQEHEYHISYPGGEWTPCDCRG